MEFKTILYVLIALFWVLSRFFQKDQPAQQPGGGGRRQLPPAEGTPQPERGAQPRPAFQRKPLPVKAKVRPGQEFSPAPISLENPVASRNPEVTTIPSSLQADHPQTAVSPSDAERIADELKNGRVDWRRAMIINELIGKRKSW